MDGIVNNIRKVAHSIYTVHATADPRSSLQALGARCLRCLQPTFLITIHPRRPIDDSASATGGEVHLSTGDSVLCLDCAVSKRPPLTGYDITLPGSLGVTITRDPETGVVTTRIRNGVRSALSSPYLIDGYPTIDMPLAKRTHDHQTSSEMQPPVEGSSEDLMVDGRGIPETVPCVWSTKERAVLRDVLTAKELLEIEMPSMAPSEAALSLKLKQRQIQRVLCDGLVLGREIRTSSIILDAEEVAAVKEELKTMMPVTAQSEGPFAVDACDRCMGFLRDAMRLQGKTCLQMINEMERKSTIRSIRCISVPTSKFKIQIDSIPVVADQTCNSQQRTNMRQALGQQMTSREQTEIPEMVIFHQCIVGNNLRRIVRRPTTGSAVIDPNGGGSPLGSEIQICDVDLYLMAVDVVKALMPKTDPEQQRFRDMPLAITAIHRSLRLHIQTNNLAIPLPSTPQLMIIYVAI